MKKIKNLALTALAALVISAPAMAKLQEGKLVIWINGDKGYNGLAEVGKKFEKRHRRTRCWWNIRIKWKRNIRK